MPEGTPTTETAPAPPEATAGVESTGTPDLSEQVTALGSRLDTVLERLPEQTQEAPPALSDDDLFGALTAEPAGQEPVPPDPYGDGLDTPADAQYASDEEAEAMRVLDQYVSERVADSTSRLEQMVEQRFRRADLAELARQNSELRDPKTLASIRERLAPYASTYGESVYTDPGLVKLALDAERGARAAAGETPVAEAAGAGAHIESGAGAGQADPDVSPEQQIIDQMAQAGGARSVFG